MPDPRCAPTTNRGSEVAARPPGAGPGGGGEEARSWGTAAPRTCPADARRGGGRDKAVLVAAGAAAAASNLAAVHVIGWIPLTPGFPMTALDVVFWGLFAVVDGMAAAYLAACLLVLLRPNTLVGVLAVALAAAPVAFSAAKFAVLGSPALIGDVLLLGDLAGATDTAAVAVASGLAVAVAVAFALNVRPAGPRRVFLDLFPVLVAGAVLAAASHSPALAARLAALLPVKTSDAPVSGHVFNAFADLVTDIDRRHAMEAARAYGQPPPSTLARVQAPPLERRNVHLVLIEAFIDPAWLKGFAFSPEPLGPLFARWRDGDGSLAVASIFGNRSANTEFEVLCGLPAAVGPSEIVFRMIPAGSELPCLPRLLAAQGFQTMATKVTGSEFYNAGPAFAAAGFETRVFTPDLDMEDRDGVWLSAEATLRQVESRAAALAAGGGAPFLNYVVMASGHYPYDRDKARRPDRISVTPEDPLVRDYVNGAHYNAVAVEAFVARIARADPWALIVVLGDHQPLLGPNYKGYRDGGRLPRVDDAPPLHKAAMFETPLLVLDAGEAVAVGRLPTFLLPEVILDRLSGGEHCRRNACAHQEAWRLRPFRDHAIEVEAHGRGERLCPVQQGSSAGAPCADAAARSRSWQAALFQALGGLRRTASAGGGG